MNGRRTRRGGTAPVFVVDAEFADAVSAVSWVASSTGYLVGRVGTSVPLLHRFVWQLKHGDCPPILDHINEIKWDCRIENLRPATKSLNGLNRKRPNKKSSGLPRGVLASSSRRNPYYAQITVGGVTRHLGSFATADAASSAYEKARSEHI